MMKPQAQVRTSLMAYSMLKRLKHVKAHAKNLLKTAGRTERGIFFRERMRLILGDLLPFYSFAGLPRNAAFENLDTRVPILDTQFLA
jgi:hypothetical protein